MPYPEQIIAAFRAALAPVEPLRQIPAGWLLYRGGGRPDAGMFPIRPGYVFLSSYPAYARSYAGDWNYHPYRYVYRCLTNQPLSVCVVQGMKSIVDVAIDLRLTTRINATIWQRENMLPIANEALKGPIDGIVFIDPNDDTTDEVLVDNSRVLLDLEDLYVFHKDHRDPTREAEVLAGGPAA